MMKKKCLSVFAACALLGVFAGCEDTLPTVPITITGVNRGILPQGATYFSLSVFNEDAKIKKVSTTESFTMLIDEQNPETNRFLVQGVAIAEKATTLTFHMPEFPPGNYVLVMGASPTTDDASKGDAANGRLFITGFLDSNTAKRKTVTVNFSTSISFDEFLGRKTDEDTSDIVATSSADCKNGFKIAKLTATDKLKDKP